MMLKHNTESKRKVILNRTRSSWQTYLSIHFSAQLLIPLSSLTATPSILHLSSLSCFHPFPYSNHHLLKLQPPPMASHIQDYASYAWSFMEAGPPLVQGATSSSGWWENILLMLLIKAIKKLIAFGLQKGSTNMPLFSRVHKYKECEHRNEMRVWMMSITKWTLPKKRKTPKGT